MGIIITHCRKGRRFIRLMLRVIVTPLRNDNSGRTEQLMAEYGALKTK
jgi:hypothetical protein